MDAITQVLNAIEQGDPHAAERLLPLVYDELRKLAAERMAQEKPGPTLQATCSLACVLFGAPFVLAADRRVDAHARNDGVAAGAAASPRRAALDRRARNAAARGPCRGRSRMSGRARVRRRVLPAPVGPDLPDRTRQRHEGEGPGGDRDGRSRRDHAGRGRRNRGGRTSLDRPLTLTLSPQAGRGDTTGPLPRAFSGSKSKSPRSSRR